MLRKMGRSLVFFSLGLLSVNLCFGQDETNNFSGFATLAYVKGLSDDEGTYSITGADLGTEGEYRDLSRFGLRYDHELDSKFSFTAQMIADGLRDFEPEFEWLYLHYYFNSHFSVELGRSLLPIYLYSDVLNVSYAYSWLSPPGSVYSTSYVTSQDGFKLRWHHSLGEFDADLTLFNGKSEENLDFLQAGLSADLEKGTGLTWTVSNDWLSIRTVLAELTISLKTDGVGPLPVDAYLTGIQALAPGLDTSVLSSLLVYDSITSEYAGLGFEANFDRSFLIAEYVYQDIDTSLASPKTQEAFYVTSGFHFPQQVTLFLSLGQRNQESDEEVLDTIAQLAGANTVFQNYASFGYLSSTEATMNEAMLGLQWRFHDLASFKTELISQEFEEYNLVDLATGAYEKETRQPQAFRIGVDLIFK